MLEFRDPFFIDFREKVLSHRLHSGEIIIDLWEHDRDKFRIESLFRDLISTSHLKSELDEDFPLLEEMSRRDAIESIKYGLSTKVNYTVIEREFSMSEMNEYAHGFFRFFGDCRCYRPSARIFKANLDLQDFWESSGAIVGDDRFFGIFWINDLYSMFKS